MQSTDQPLPLVDLADNQSPEQSKSLPEKTESSEDDRKEQHRREVRRRGYLKNRDAISAKRKQQRIDNPEAVRAEENRIRIARKIRLGLKMRIKETGTSKRCRICQQEKSLTKFYNRGRVHRTECISCMSRISSERHKIKHPPKPKPTPKTQDELKAHRKIKNARSAQYRKDRLARLRLDPEFVARERKAGMDHFMANKPKIYAYRAERRRTNPQYKIGCNLRTYLFQKIGQRKTGPESRFTALVGCTVAELCAHLESHFGPEMSWDNYGKGDGKWSIDHTKPVALFDLTDPEQQKACFHFSNMKPMWWRENLQKRDSFPLPSPTSMPSIANGDQILP